MNAKYKEGETITYTVGSNTYSSGTIVSINEATVGKGVMYLVSEGPGAVNMKYVCESRVRQLLNG